VDAAPGHVIAVAASAGGVEALRTLVADLPANLDAAVCIVLHIPAEGRSLLAPILDRESRPRGLGRADVIRGVVAIG
jgi:two-component system chemotaxis response regulator CheB